MFLASIKIRSLFPYSIFRLNNLVLCFVFWISFSRSADQHFYIVQRCCNIVRANTYQVQSLIAEKKDFPTVNLLDDAIKARPEQVVASLLRCSGLLIQENISADDDAIIDRAKIALLAELSMLLTTKALHNLLSALDLLHTSQKTVITEKKLSHLYRLLARMVWHLEQCSIERSYQEFLEWVIQLITLVNGDLLRRPACGQQQSFEMVATQIVELCMILNRQSGYHNILRAKVKHAVVSNPFFSVWFKAFALYSCALHSNKVLVGVHDLLARADSLAGAFHVWVLSPIIEIYHGIFLKKKPHMLTHLDTMQDQLHQVRVVFDEELKKSNKSLDDFINTHKTLEQDVKKNMSSLAKHMDLSARKRVEHVEDQSGTHFFTSILQLVAQAPIVGLTGLNKTTQELFTLLIRSAISSEFRDFVEIVRNMVKEEKESLSTMIIPCIDLGYMMITTYKREMYILSLLIRLLPSVVFGLILKKIYRVYRRYNYEHVKRLFSDLKESIVALTDDVQSGYLYGKMLYNVYRVRSVAAACSSDLLHIELCTTPIVMKQNILKHIERVCLGLEEK